MADYGANLPPAEPWELTQAQDRLRTAEREVRLWTRLVEMLEDEFDQIRRGQRKTRS